MATQSPHPTPTTSSLRAAVGSGGAFGAEAEVSAVSAELMVHERHEENESNRSIDEVPGGDASFWSCVLNQVCGIRIPSDTSIYIEWQRLGSAEEL